MEMMSFIHRHQQSHFKLVSNSIKTNMNIKSALNRALIEYCIVKCLISGSFDIYVETFSI